MIPLLQARGLARQFREDGRQALSVLDGITLTLHAGEVVCLLGASGSGKTTLLRILSGLDQPDHGDIRSDIQRPGHEFGYLSQNDHLLPWRTVVDNVMLGMELLGQNKETARRAALVCLEQVGMTAFADHYPTQLSGGMQQRVLLARTFSLQPRLLLLDEPMSSLDVLARRELAALIKDYTRTRQVATLVVTHSVEEACFLADRVLLVTRAPAKLYKEIRITDSNGGDGLFRGEALDIVMQALLAALEASA